jgi:hypothetical protein
MLFQSRLLAPAVSLAPQFVVKMLFQSRLLATAISLATNTHTVSMSERGAIGHFFLGRSIKLLLTDGLAVWYGIGSDVVEG